MKKYRLKKDEVIDEHGYVKKKGFFSWLLNYGYYYKSYLIAGLVFVGFFVALAISMRSVEPDMKVIFCVQNPLDEESYQAFCNNAYAYTLDIDNNDSLYMEPRVLELVENPQTTSEKTAYRDLEEALEDRDVVFFVTDEFGYEHLMSQNMVRDLAFFGINSDEEYRLRLNDTALWENVPAKDDYYLVMKYVPDEEYEEYFLSAVTSMVADMCYQLTGYPEGTAE